MKIHMIQLRKSFSPGGGGVGGWFLLSLRISLSQSITQCFSLLMLNLGLSNSRMQRLPQVLKEIFWITHLEYTTWDDQVMPQEFWFKYIGFFYIGDRSTDKRTHTHWWSLRWSHACVIHMLTIRLVGSILAFAIYLCAS